MPARWLGVESEQRKRDQNSGNHTFNFDVDGSDAFIRRLFVFLDGFWRLKIEFAALVARGQHRQLEIARETLMDIVGVVYMSRSTRLMSSSDLDRLLLDARTSNAVANVTGVLLYGDGQFFQYFEGRQVDVASVYERIHRSSLHKDLVELERRQTSDRLFRKWFMGFREAPASVIQKLSQEQWERELPWVEDQAPASPGMQRLLAFLGPSQI